MEIIIEIANTHEGSIEYLYKHIEELNKINVQNIKFQYLIPKEFGDAGSENFIEFSRLEVKKEDFEEIINLYPNINFYFDVFGELSLNQVFELMKSHKNIMGIKLHATSSMNFILIKNISKYIDDIFISISGLTAIEINNLIQFCYKENINKKIVLTYGVQNYPTDIKDIKINKLVELKKIYNLRICLSEHLDGDLKLSKDIVNFANILEYDFVEKHSTLNRSRRLDDDHSALNVNELESLIKEQEEIKKLKSKDILSLSKSEIIYRNKVKSGLFVTKNLQKDHVLNINDIEMKRLEDGRDYFLNINDILGKKIKENINKNQIFKPSFVQLDVLGVILVRNGSSRLAEKALRHIGDIPSIDFLMKRLKKSQKITKLVLCTTTSSQDDILEKYALSNEIECIRGNENVYERLELVFSKYNCDLFLRLTGDNVFVDSEHIDTVVDRFIEGSYDYYKHEKVIDGCDFEIIKKDSYKSLDVYFKNYRENSEYMTLFLKNNYFRIMPSLEYNYGIDYLKYRFTLDYVEDLENINNAYSIFTNLYFSYRQICQSIKNNEFEYKYFHPTDKAINIKPKRTI